MTGQFVSYMSKHYFTYVIYLFTDIKDLYKDNRYRMWVGTIS